MKVIGAGFGRTGTMSVRAALVQLGYGPCYHFEEVVYNPHHAETWLAAQAGESVDWHTFLQSYQAGLDYPFCNYYDVLMTAFPDAKVLLTVRDADSWYASTRETIYRFTGLPRWLTIVLPSLKIPADFSSAIAWDTVFGGRFEDKAHAIAVYEQHIETVKATVPAEKLLVYNVKQGWEPLCAFLGCPVPDTPLPHLNNRQQMGRIIQTLFFIGRYGPFILAALIALLFWRFFT